MTALILALVGQSAQVSIGVGAALFFALALVSSAVVFLAVGALASQLAATRRQAAAYAGAALGACYALRMVADSGIGLEWLRWATPLGWVEQLQPLTAPQPLALLPIAALVSVLAYLTVYLAGRRDLGASTLPDRASAPPHTRLLFGPMGLSVRLIRPIVLGWIVALAAGSLLLGLIAKPAGAALSGSNSINRVLSHLGAHGAGAKAYLGVAFLMMSLLAGPHRRRAGQRHSGRGGSGTPRPPARAALSRWSWLGGRVLEATAVIVISGLGVGAFTWLGAASQHAGLPFSSVVDAGLNMVPPALFVLGVGALVIGVWPRATSIAIYGLIVWSILVTLVGGFSNNNHWLLDTSLFHQMAPAPASAPNWTAGGVMIAIGAAAAMVGGAAFRHRDLVGE